MNIYVNILLMSMDLVILQKNLLLLTIPSGKYWIWHNKLIKFCSNRFTGNDAGDCENIESIVSSQFASLNENPSASGYNILICQGMTSLWLLLFNILLLL